MLSFKYECRFYCDYFQFQSLCRLHIIAHSKHHIVSELAVFSMIDITCYSALNTFNTYISCMQVLLSSIFPRNFNYISARMIFSINIMWTNCYVTFAKALNVTTTLTIRYTVSVCPITISTQSNYMIDACLWFRNSQCITDLTSKVEK